MKKTMMLFLSVVWLFQFTCHDARAEELGGIGINYKMINGYLVIDTFTNNSSAKAVGMLPEDKIIKINTRNIYGMSELEIADLLRGRIDTVVNIEVQRKGTDSPLVFNVVRRSMFREPPQEPILRIEAGQHTGPIRGLGLDRSGRWLVSASDDMTVRVWDLQEGIKPFSVLHPSVGITGHEKLSSVAISHDGELIAVGKEPTGEIFLFSRSTGRLLGRIKEGAAQFVYHLAFSPDGQLLLALIKGEGLCLFAVNKSTDAKHPLTLSKIAQDRDFANFAEMRADLSSDGNRMVTISDGGYLRLYDFSTVRKTDQGVHQIHPILTNKALGGKTPHGVKFSPDGTQITVVLDDSPSKVNVLSSSDLSLLYTPDTADIQAGGVMLAVDWSADGRTLLAGGWNMKLFDGVWHNAIRSWNNAGQGGFKDMNCGLLNTITALAALPDGRFVFGDIRGGMGILSGTGRETKDSVLADFNRKHADFKLSDDGSIVQFDYEREGKYPAVFSQSDHSLKHAVSSKTLSAPDTDSLNITGWNGSFTPALDNKYLVLPKGEWVASLAIAKDRRSFLLGTGKHLRKFDSAGNQQWVISISGSAIPVNISRDGRIAVATLNDGTIRWYRYSDGKELVALFPHPDKERWVLWTPEGFFDHSPGAEDLIGFHLNQGRDRAAEFVPVSKLYNQFYRPDLVTASFEGKDISGFAKAIDINRILSIKTLPPKVRLITQSATTEKTETEIAAEICDNGGGIGDVTLYLNNMPIAVESNGRGLKAQPKQHEACYKFTRSLTLGNGNNVISLMAYNRDNTIESDRPSVTIHHTSNFSGKPNLHILTVAVDSYRDGDLHLKYSKADAKGLAELLRSKASGLFESINLHTLSDAEVTKDRLDATFSAIGQKVRRQDMFILFVAGHGITYSKDGSFYFLPVNFRYSQDDDIPRQGVSMDDFKKYLAKIQASKSLLLLDTCNSGSFAEAIASRGLLEKTAINKLTRAVGRHTIVASSKSQVALEGFQGHGAFSYVLLDGMKGRAANNKGQITVNSLVSFVETELPELTYKKWGYEQIPQKSLVGEDFAIGISR